MGHQTNGHKMKYILHSGAISNQRPNCMSIFKDAHNARKHLQHSYGHGRCTVGRAYMHWEPEQKNEWTCPL
eukprot:4115854-Pyramimonas_sp.AAC.1